MLRPADEEGQAVMGRRNLLLLVCLAAPTVAAKRPAVYLSVRMDSTGEVSARAWGTAPGLEVDGVMASVLGCPEAIRKDFFGQFRCRHALARSGLARAARLNLAPFAGTLNSEEVIQLDVNHPVLGFTEAPGLLGAPAQTTRTYRAVRLPAAEAGQPFRIRFGYRPDQLWAVYLPLGLAGLLLTSVTAALRRTGLAHLQHAVFAIGSMAWFGLVWQLRAVEPLAILSGSLVPGVAFYFLTPLLCVATGAAFPPKPQFRQTFWTFGVITLPVACAMAALPQMLDNNWWTAGPWFGMGAVSVFYARRRLAALGGAATRYLPAGHLRDRVRELAAKVGRRDVKVCIVKFERSRLGNAFALFPNTVVLTEPLLETLSRREVDAIVGHELTHLGDRARPVWVPYLVAAFLFQTSLLEVLSATPLAANVVLSVLVVSFLGALCFSRRREYSADAGSLAIAGDPRGLISGLTRLARFNQQPLCFPGIAEWFSTHPSTTKRVARIAALGAVAESERQTLSTEDQPGDRYEIPCEDTTGVFSGRWQIANATRYGWASLLAPAAVAITAASLHAGLPGLLLAVAAAKGMVSAIMALGYFRLARKLRARLGEPGIAAGLAPGPEPRVFDGYRFPDAGLLQLDGDLLRYRSERTLLELRAGDVAGVSLVAAAPSSWRRVQPLVEFRHPETGEAKAVIFHSLHWDTSGRRLFRQIEQWRGRAPAGAGPGRVEQLVEPEGERFCCPTVKSLFRSFQIPLAITLVVTTPLGMEALYAVAVLAAAYGVITVPALLYRTPQPQTSASRNQPIPAE